MQDCFSWPTLLEVMYNVSQYTKIFPLKVLHGWHRGVEGGGYRGTQRQQPGSFFPTTTNTAGVHCMMEWAFRTIQEECELCVTMLPTILSARFNNSHLETTISIYY